MVLVVAATHVDAALTIPLVLSELRPNRNLGILIASTVSVCYVTTLLVLPRLMRFERVAP